MTIAKRKAGRPESDLARVLIAAVILRYRAAGHLRFDLPEPLTSLGAAEMLRQGLRAVAGVYRINIYRHPAKLSIRFDGTVCDDKALFRALAALIPPIAAHLEELSAPPSAPRRFLDRLKEIGPIQRLRARYDRLKQTGTVAARVIGSKMGLAEPLPFNARDWTLNFLNDLVAFYLIKLHWERLSKQWLLDPLKYRYQWATVIYLVFLLVQSRKAKK